MRLNVLNRVLLPDTMHSVSDIYLQKNSLQTSVSLQVQSPSNA